MDVDAYYRRFGPMVLRRCRRLLKDEQLALDAMHDVFVQLIVYQGKLVENAPSSLLYRIATNVCLNRIRSERRRPEDKDDELLSRIAGAVDHGERSMAKKILDRIFGEQMESTRTMAVLFWVDGMTLEEVAHEVGLSVSGVRKRLRTLREHVGALEGA